MVRTGNGKNVVRSDIQSIVIPSLPMSVSVQKSSILEADVERLRINYKLNI